MGPLPHTRREALRAMGTGFGMTAFASLIGNAAAADNPWSPKAPHFPPKAKHVIFVFSPAAYRRSTRSTTSRMLDKYDGKPLPYKTPRTEFATGNLMRSPFEFTMRAKRARGQRDLPQCRRIIDEFCQVRSVVTDIPNHGPVGLMTNTGASRVGRHHGLVGRLRTRPENQNLPGFVVLAANRPGTREPCGSAFLPSIYQGTPVPLKETIQGSRSSIWPIPSSAWPAARQLDYLRVSNRITWATRPRNRVIDPVDGGRLPHADRGAGRV